MRRPTTMLVVLVAFICMPMSANAHPTKRWAWSESYAEKRVAAKIHLSCQQAYPTSGCSSASIATYQQALNSCIQRTGGDPSCNEYYLPRIDEAKALVAGFGVSHADCIGSGTPTRGYFFAAFRCKVFLDNGYVSPGWARVFVRVTGKTTFLWRLI